MAEIIEQKKNPFLNREEALILVDHKGKPTPKRENVLKEVSEALKAKEELIIIDKIFTTAGKQSSEAKVLVYSKKEDIPKEKAEKMARRLLPLGQRKPQKEDTPSEDGDSATEAPKEDKKDEETKETKGE